MLVAHGNSLRALFVHLGIKNEKTIESFEIGTGVPIQVDVVNKTYKYLNAYTLCAYQIIDSRGYPSLEVQCYDKESKKCIGKGSTPSGASCGSTEVCEMRDGQKGLFHGKSVYRTVENIRKINDHFVLSKKTLTNLSNCDKQFNDLDGTEMKTKYGGNTSTALSFCLANCAANLKNMEMYEYFAEHYKMKNSIDVTKLPTPFVNIINGGKHGVTENLKIQEFMIFANENLSTSTQIRIYCEVYHSLKKLLVEKIKFVIENKFKRVSYTEAIDILKNSKPNKKKKFDYLIEEWGTDLQSEHERYLVEKHFKAPVILFDYPAKIKAFYMRMNEDQKTVRAMDILFPGIGEIVGGSQREERLDVLEKRIEELGIDAEELWWYLDLRRYGSVPHSGFGLGFERLVLFATGMSNIRDVIPFPRTPQNATF